MGRFLMRLKGREGVYILEWSTIVDAPVTFGMPLAEFEAYYKEQYGANGLRELPERLARLEKYGTSLVDGRTPQDAISGNRAGPNEKRLTLREIYKAYCLQQPIRDGWTVPTVEVPE